MSHLYPLCECLTLSITKGHRGNSLCVLGGRVGHQHHTVSMFAGSCVVRCSFMPLRHEAHELVTGKLQLLPAPTHSQPPSRSCALSSP